MTTKAQEVFISASVNVSKLFSDMKRFSYDSGWREEYRTRSPGVIDKTGAESIMCLEAALYFATHVESIADDVKLIAMHRKDKDGHECGHCICLFKVNGAYGAYSHSNIASLISLKPEYPSIESVIKFYMNSYLSSGYTPLYYGIYELEELDEQGIEDWRDTDEDLSSFSDYLIENYQFELTISS